MSGWACRYGEDEFIYEDNKINITCSFGVSYLNNGNIAFDDTLNLVYIMLKILEVLYVIY